MREGAFAATESNPTVLFDHETGDILLVYYDGSIVNFGPFGSSVKTGKGKSQ